MEKKIPKNKKTLAAQKKAKEEVEKSEEALDSAIQKLDADDLDKVAGGGLLDNVPPVDEKPYDPDDKNRY